MRGLLDVEPLHFVMSAGSEQTRVENMDAMSQLQFNASNMQQFSSTQMLEDLMFDSSLQLNDYSDADPMYATAVVGGGGVGGSVSGSIGNSVTLSSGGNGGSGSNKISLGMGPGGKFHYIKVIFAYFEKMHR